MKTGTSFVALAALLLGGCAASAADIPDWCRYALSDAPKSAPGFDAYAVPVQHVTHAPRVRLRTPRARLYRTQLRDAARLGAQTGANFAGHYRLASWGCGTGCLSWGVVDLKTGRVAFDNKMFTLENARVDFSREKEDGDYARQRRAFYEFGVLAYRPDSSLLMTLGQPNEDAARDGMAFYHWTGKTFRRIARPCPKKYSAISRARKRLVVARSREWRLGCSLVFPDHYFHCQCNRISAYRLAHRQTRSVT